MRCYVDCTNYKAKTNKTADWMQTGKTMVLFESDSREETIKFFDSYTPESFCDHGSDLSKITRPASIQVISILEMTNHATEEPGFKYLEEL
jgi:hypothetical protein